MTDIITPSPTSKRREKIAALQKERGDRLVISYITSTRPGLEIQISDDILPYLYRHLEAGKTQARSNGVDLFIHSNGGSGTAPWRVVNLIREYTIDKEFSVLVPNHAFSAATLIAMGAHSIVMHKMGCLGPIDPSVSNAFNPPHPLLPGQLARISVEDVTAYFKLVKESVGIQHEDELIQALVALTDKIHPLALGNVQRHHLQARLIAKKLLKKHMEPEKDHEISQIIDNLKSNIHYHGHPINRNEAASDLKLKIVAPTETVEELMWSLYLGYENALKLNEPFNVLHEIDIKAPPAPPLPPTPQDIIAQIHNLAASGIQLGAVSETQLVNLAAAMLPHLSGVAKPNRVRLERMPGAYVESVSGTDVFLTDMDIERLMVPGPSGPQVGIKQEVLWQRWETET